MKNLTCQTKVLLPILSVQHVVVFLAVAITSALVFITSCLVLKYVYLKERRSRTDLLFAIISITDIGVDLLTITFGWVSVACIKFVKCSALITYLIDAFNFFPLFPYLITTVITIDRVLLIIKHYKYKTIVATARLKIIVAFLFVFSNVFIFLVVYHLAYLERHFTIYKIVVLGTKVVLGIPLQLLLLTRTFYVTFIDVQIQYHIAM